MRVAESAGYTKWNGNQTAHDERIQNERDFHDAWAKSTDLKKVNVRASNEACTAPEMRYIAQRLGGIKGKRLLDVGCGLGEASVYFAILGADVTSSDLSKGMLDATRRLAQINGVTVKTHVASAEDMQLSPDTKFDIIYAGNLLHHVDIEETITRIKPHLADDGVFVTWDPLAYNPVINVYRSMAIDVRTPDEHPLKWEDIKLFHKYFRSVETRYFWLTTLIIFVIMALAQRRNPNKERFWKVVVQEEKKWAWLYAPLESFDRLLLAIFPPLRLLCWNVVIICKA
jgi:SAM-dependent methyltransferase